MDAHALEDTRPCSERKWKHKKLDLIDKVMLEQGVRQLADAILQQALARHLLKLPDLISSIPLDEFGVPLERLPEGS